MQITFRPAVPTHSESGRCVPAQRGVVRLWWIALAESFTIVARMKRWIFLPVLAGFSCGFVRAADEAMRASKPEVKKEIVAVIEAQLAAFRTGDVRAAYGYAAVELRAVKPLPLFVEIVRTSYPEIWTNTRAECGLVRDNGALAQLPVHVFGKDGDTTYDYTLVKERAGWRIRDVLRHAPKKAEKV